MNEISDISLDTWDAWTWSEKNIDQEMKKVQASIKKSKKIWSQIQNKQLSNRKVASLLIILIQHVDDDKIMEFIHNSIMFWYSIEKIFMIFLPFLRKYLTDELYSDFYKDISLDLSFWLSWYIKYVKSYILSEIQTSKTIEENIFDSKDYDVIIKKWKTIEIKIKESYFSNILCLIIRYFRLIDFWREDEQKIIEWINSTLYW